MQGGSYWEKHAICPFYRRESKKGKSISCEGTEPGQTISLIYRRESNRVRQLERCCSWDYKKCPIYLAGDRDKN